MTKFIINNKTVELENEKELSHLICKLNFDLITDWDNNSIIRTFVVNGRNCLDDFYNLFDYFECDPFEDKTWNDRYEKYPLRICNLQEIKVMIP